MTVLLVNPDYQQCMTATGLTCPGAFLRLFGEITAGHPDRHVQRLQLGPVDSGLSVFLKREHQCRWRDRWRNFAAGFGFVSRSLREWKTLSQLRRLHVACPEPLAAGEDGCGRAFLLLRQVPGALELRHYLYVHRSEQDRVGLFENLGRELARLHSTGHCHFDLYSKHVLVCRRAGSPDISFVLLDWQRSFRMQRLPWIYRRRDLACLCATLTEELFPSSSRSAFLESYVSECHPEDRRQLPGPGQAANHLDAIVRRLARKRSIRELCQPPLGSDAQNLIWLDGEALCVTRKFFDLCQGSIPADFQPYATHPPHSPSSAPPRLLGMTVTHSFQEERIRWRRWYWALCGPARTSSKLRDAATLFRLERFHVAVPQLLAVGQRSTPSGRLASFLLTEPHGNAIRLRDWFRAGSASGAHCRMLRRRVAGQMGEALRSIHAADCVLGKQTHLVLLGLETTHPRIGVDSVTGMRPRRRVSQAARRADLRRLLAEFNGLCSATDKLRFLLSYLQIRRLTPDARNLIRMLSATTHRAGLSLQRGRA